MNICVKLPHDVKRKKPLYRIIPIQNFFMDGFKIQSRPFFYLIKMFMVVLRRNCHVHFSQLYPYFVVKKSPFHTTGFCDHKDEYTNHHNCLNNSYYQMPMLFYACMGVCCNSPLLGRKGVRKMSYSKERKEHIEYTFATFCRVVLRNAALSAYRDIGRRRKHEIS